MGDTLQQTCTLKKKAMNMLSFLSLKNCFHFKANASYYSECPEVMSKINNETYQYKDIITIVKAYNNCFRH